MDYKKILSEFGLENEFDLLWSETRQLQAVKQNGDSIRYISNPSEKVQLEAVKQDGDSILHIQNPSEKVQLEAVKENGYSIRYIQNPSEKEQLEAVKQYGDSIQYIQNPSEKVQLEIISYLLKTENPTQYIHKFTSDKALRLFLQQLVVKDIII